VEGFIPPEKTAIVFLIVERGTAESGREFGFWHSQPGEKGTCPLSATRPGLLEPITIPVTM